jgi:hypothetical protein
LKATTAPRALTKYPPGLVSPAKLFPFTVHALGFGVGVGVGLASQDPAIPEGWIRIDTTLP